MARAHQQENDLSQKSSCAVEIVSIPRKFQASGFGALHQLFLPLLALARDAYQGQANSSSEQAYRAASYMAGELLRDANFVPGRSFTTPPNTYVLNFQERSVEVEAEIFSESNDASALFRVKITGDILGEEFAVQDPSNHRPLFTFTLSEASKPEFFEREFPFMAYQVRSNAGPAASDASNELLDQEIDMQMGIGDGPAGLTVRISKRKGDPLIEVTDKKTGVCLVKLPCHHLNNIAGLQKAIKDHMTQKVG